MEAGEGGGRLLFVGLVTLRKVGTDGGGTAMPRLDLQTRQKQQQQHPESYTSSSTSSTSNSRSSKVRCAGKCKLS